MIQYQKQTYVQNLNGLRCYHKNDVTLQSVAVTSQRLRYQFQSIFLNNFGEHQSACQIWCSYVFWLRS